MIPLDDVTFAMLIKMKREDGSINQNYYENFSIMDITKKIKVCVQPNVSFLTKWNYFGNA